MTRIRLIAAPHTPMDEAGELLLDRVEDQCRHLIETGVDGVFIAGSTGECHSMMREEREALAKRWVEVARSTDLEVVVHVGHNCLPVAAALARQAADIGADAIAALSPSYFKPHNVDALVDCCAVIAANAPELPFYYYEIPELTGVSLPMDEFLEKGKEKIDSLAGLKYTHSDLMQFQNCLRLDDGAFDILFGRDEALVAGLALGATGAVGSTYNFLAPLYRRLIDAFQTGDLETARLEQARSVQLIEVLNGYGYTAAAKTVMAKIGVDCGPVRLPLSNLNDEQLSSLQKDLEATGFFDWRR